ncbi:MAG TPA: NUDIX hydrolase [Gemmatimonadales bacterium]|nr:NUDIX hydrolase [Gemmatimonadales bacterium]
MYHYFGAVLFNDAGEVLLRRPAAGDERGSWTFAERQGDEFHTPEETALEAVVEQIGYNCRLLGTVPGTFAHGNDFTEFFFMTPVGEQQPFLPELTGAIAWFSPDDASMRIGEGGSGLRRQRDLDVLASAIAEYEAKLARHW